MKRLIAFGVMLASLLVAGCGGGGGSITSPPGSAGSDAGVSTVQVTASSNTLNSSAAPPTTSVQIFALVLDSNNAPVENLPVSFQASSGQITVTQAVTDASGTAIATLNNGTNPANRAITVTATAGGVASTVVVNVVGTTLTIAGPPALALTDSGNYAIQLRDSQGAGLNQTVTVTSATGNTVAPGSVLTSAGQGQVTVTATTPGADTITASALGVVASTPVTVSDDIFAILTPTEDQELPIGVPTDVTVQWTKAGVPQAGEDITFTFDRGTISSSIGTTDGAGEATVQVTGTSAGRGNISATNDEGTSTSVGVLFVASVAANITLQASPLSVATGQRSTLTATVLDPTNNKVKNKLVVFVIDQDSTGGFLTIGSGLTDANGRVQTEYQAGSFDPSANNGVAIRAFVQENPPLAPAVQATVNLTVVGRAVDISIGTGDELFEPTSALYSKEWAIIVTDTSGTAPVPVAGENVQAGIRSRGFHKGEMALVDNGAGDAVWAPVLDPSATPPVQGYADDCPDEDLNQDGFLTPGPCPAGEDCDQDGQLEAGNRATLSALAPGAPANACESIGGGGGPTTTVLTDSNGVARVCVIYLQSDNLWVDVQISANINVSGTAYQEFQSFTLDALAEDLNDENSSPAGRVSPFGRLPGCDNPL